MSNQHHFKNSTSVKFCDYDDEKNTLIIKFASGATYHYPDCDKDHYHNLKAAKSAGQYFQANIRALKAHRK